MRKCSPPHWIIFNPECKSTSLYNHACLDPSLTESKPTISPSDSSILRSKQHRSHTPMLSPAVKFSGAFVRSLRFAYDEQMKQPKLWSLKYHIDHVLQKGKTASNQRTSSPHRSRPSLEVNGYLNDGLCRLFVDVRHSDGASNHHTPQPCYHSA